jgi:hypothetical protein
MMGNLWWSGAVRTAKYALAGMLCALPLALGGAGAASAVPASPAHVEGAAATRSVVTKVYDDDHSRWRSHRRHGSEHDYEHSRWRSHSRWGSEYEHNRWRSHSRWGSDGGGYEHSRSRSHHRHGSEY